MPTLSDKYPNLPILFESYAVNSWADSPPPSVDLDGLKDAAKVNDRRFPVHESLMSVKVHPYLSTTAGSGPQVKGCFWI